MAEDPKESANAKPGAAGRLRPTIVEAPPKRAKRRSNGASAGETATPRVTTPTAIPGVARERIAVRPADMIRLSPGAASRTAARAVALVDGFVVERARDQHVAQWGLAAQELYAALVLEAPSPSEAGVLGRTHGHMGQIVHLLKAIDLEAIREDRPTSLLAFLGAPGDRIDTPRRLATARADLTRLAALTRTALGPLQALQDRLAEQSRRIAEVRAEIEAAALAALFLSEHLATSRPGLSRHFLQREMSLTQTAIQIQTRQFERDGHVEEPRALIAAIQDVVLTTLADWLNDTAARPHATWRRLPPTEVGELQLRLRAILRKLDA